jgi:hypothetical protein
MLRRLPLSVPLAVVAALLAHTAEFGLSHAFGGALGFGLITGSIAALALAAILTPAAIALGVRAFRTWSLGFVMCLGCEIAAGGVAAYVGMEHLEGHAPAFALWRTFALLSAALSTLLATMIASSGLARVGCAFAAGLREIARVLSSVYLSVSRTFKAFVVSFVGDPSLGRAPPLRV